MVANGTLGKEKFNFNIVEADENGNIDAGKVLINGKGIDVEFTSIKEDIKSVKDDILNLEPSFNIAVGNENQNIPCANNGYTSISMLIEIPFVGYVGLTQTPCTVSVGVLPSGITVGEIIDSTETITGKIIFNVAKNSNLGGDNVLNGTIPLTFTISEKTIVKNFTWTKTKAGDPGQNGQNARLFSLDTSTYVIKKNTDETLTPSTIVFSSYYKDGESDTRNDYLGRFLISESTDGLKYSTKYVCVFRNESYEIQILQNRCKVYNFITRLASFSVLAVRLNLFGFAVFGLRYFAWVIHSQEPFFNCLVLPSLLSFLSIFIPPISPYHFLKI